MNRSEALDIARRARVSLDRDFHTLRSEEVEALLAEADARRYRKPRNAPGSRGRMFFQALQRAASRQEG